MKFYLKNIGIAFNWSCFRNVRFFIRKLFSDTYYWTTSNFWLKIYQIVFNSNLDFCQKDRKIFLIYLLFQAMENHIAFNWSCN